MAKEVVQQRGEAIRLACAVSITSKSCYRYQSQLNAENEHIANWLMRLTDNNRSWGFGLCYLRKLPSKVNKLKIETSISLRVRDEEVKIYGKSDCWNIG